MGKKTEEKSKSGKIVKKNEKIWKKITEKIVTIFNNKKSNCREKKLNKLKLWRKKSGKFFNKKYGAEKKLKEIQNGGKT